MGGWDLGIDIFSSIWNNGWSVTPNYGQITDNPLDLNDQGTFICTRCDSLKTNLGKINTAKFASNLIFGKSRIVNKGSQAYANLIPYANGVEGLTVVLADGMQVEVRVKKMSDITLRGLARRNGGVLTFVIVLEDDSAIEFKLNVKFDHNQELVDPPDEFDDATQDQLDDIAAFISGEGGSGINCHGCGGNNILNWGFGFGGSSRVGIVTTESVY
jgi:hypothetical protein